MEAFERECLLEIDQTCDAAARLAELYWEHHLRYPNTAVPLVENLQDIPARFRHPPQDGYLILATLGLQAALSAIQNAASGAKRWQEREYGPSYTLSHPSGEAEVALVVPYELPDGILGPDVIDQMWQKVFHFNDLDGDVLLILIAHALAVGLDRAGGTWITVEDILGMRGIKPKQHVATDGSKRDAGVRAEDIEKVMMSINRLRDLYVTVREERIGGKKKARKRTVRQRSYLFLLSDVLERDRESKDREKKGPLSLAWYYRLGKCLGALPFRKSVEDIEGRALASWLLRQALCYDPVRELWEKRLARYFFLHLRVNNSLGNASMERTISTLFSEASLTMNEGDPEKTKQRFERAMMRLVEDGHISDWSEQHYRERMMTLPSHHWITTWLAAPIWIAAAPLRQKQIDVALDRLRR